MVYAVVQTVIVMGIVAFSLMQIIRKLMPQTARRAQGRIARMLHLKGLEPVSASPQGCGSDDGCGGCKGCASIAALTRDLPKA